MTAAFCSYHKSFVELWRRQGCAQLAKGYTSSKSLRLGTPAAVSANCVASSIALAKPEASHAKLPPDHMGPKAAVPLRNVQFHMVRKRRDMVELNHRPALGEISNQAIQCRELVIEGDSTAEIGPVANPLPFLLHPHDPSVCANNNSRECVRQHSRSDNVNFEVRFRICQKVPSSIRCGRLPGFPLRQPSGHASGGGTLQGITGLAGTRPLAAALFSQVNLSEEHEMSVLRKFALASVVSLSAIGMSSGANAAWHHHGGHWGGGFGPGFVGGFAFGALASPYAWGVVRIIMAAVLLPTTTARIATSGAAS